MCEQINTSAIGFVKSLLTGFFMADSCSAPACDHKWAFSILMLHNLLAIVMELLPSRLSGARSVRRSTCLL